jgi:ElaB/YqjD/DUF883 family membrane-anchored ribosome-binding protein
MVNKSTVTKTSDGISEASFEEIQRQFATLKDDISALSATVLALGTTKKDAAIAAGADRAGALAGRGKVALDQAEESFGTFLQDMEKTVRAKPFTALAISAALGLVFGLFTSQRR